MIKVLSLFSGIGAFEKALKRVGIDCELVNYCEIDKHASKSYSEIHNVSEDLNLWDVTTIDTNKLSRDIDLLTHGSPCQSYSVAGKQEGGDKGSGTQSSLMWETVRIIEDVKPKIIIWENVKNVLSQKHKHNFDAYIESLNNLNYNSYYKVLNAKDYGIPQNRERIFVISIRKDIDDGNFKFPEGFPLALRLKDVLDEVVDEKYYLKQKDTEKFKMVITSGKNGCQQVGFLDRPTTHEFSNRIYSTDGIARTLMGSGGNQNDKAGQYLIEPSIQRIDIPQIVKVRKYPVDCKLLCECLRDHKKSSGLSNKEIAKTLNVPLTMAEHWFRQDVYFAIPDADIWFDLKNLLGIKTDEFDESIMTFEEKEGVYEKSNRCYHENGIAPTLTSTSADEKIIIDDLYKNREIRTYDEYSPSLRAERQGLKVADKPSLVGGIGEKNFGKQYRQGNRIYDSNAVAMALNASPVGNAGGNSYLYTVEDLKIRKLTPKECFRLMGFDDEDFEKAAKVCSLTQLYKQAGNSIVVNVLEEIFKNLRIYLEK